MITVFMIRWLSIWFSSSGLMPTKIIFSVCTSFILGLSHHWIWPSPQGRSFSWWWILWGRFRISLIVILSSRSTWRFTLTSIFKILCVKVIILILPASKFRNSLMLVQKNKKKKFVSDCGWQNDWTPSTILSEVDTVINPYKENLIIHQHCRNNTRYTFRRRQELTQQF